MKLSCYQNVVVSLKLTYVQNSASDELERNHNKTTKVNLIYVYNQYRVLDLLPYYINIVLETPL